MRVLCATVDTAAPAARRIAAAAAWRARDGGERGGDEGREEVRARGEAAGEELGVGLQQVARGLEAPQDPQQLLLHWCGGDSSCHWGLFPAVF